MHYLLFTTTRCPKCPAFKNFVAEKVPFKGEVLDETHPDFQLKVAEFGVSVAPLMVVFSSHGSIRLKATEIPDLEDFLTDLER